MRSTLLSIGSILFATTVACSSGGAGEPTFDAALEASTDVSGDAACLTVEPKEGSPCTSTQSVCIGGDACCRGYVWTCSATTNTWMKSGLGCPCGAFDTGVDVGDTADAVDAADAADAGPFTCGDATCKVGELCEAISPGVPTPDGGTPKDSTSCIPLPADCVATPTCACVKAKIGASCASDRCTDDGGRVQLHCMGA